MADDKGKKASESNNPAIDGIRGDGALPRSFTDVVLSGVAYALYWSFLVTCLIFPVSTQAAVGPTLTILPALCGLGSCTATLYVYHKTGWSIFEHGAAKYVALGAVLTVPLLTAMALSAFHIQATLLMQAFGWTLWGVGQAVLFPLMGMIQSCASSRSGNHPLILKFIPAAFLVVALLGLFSLFAPDPFRSLLPTIYFAAAVISTLACAARSGINRAERDGGEAGDGMADVPGSIPMSSAKVLSPCIIGATFSMLLCYDINHFGMSTTLGIVAVASLIGGACMLAAVKYASKRLVNAFIERCFFPITAICFFLISCLPDNVRIIPACLAASMFFVYAVFHWSFLLSMSHRLSIASPRHYSTGLLSPAAGLFIGWAASSTFALLGGNMGSPFMLFFGWIVAYIIVLSVAPYASDPSFEIEIFSPGVPQLSSDTGNSSDASGDAAPSSEDGVLDRSGNTWEKACARIALERRLSPREQEVFLMLAHGRNVEYISDALFISSNTAKTHKYRIYRKLEVNNHQELLDKVEEAEKDMLLEG